MARGVWHSAGSKEKPPLPFVLHMKSSFPPCQLNAMRGTFGACRVGARLAMAGSPQPPGSPGGTALKINTEEISIPFEKHLGAFRRLLCGTEKTFPPSSLLLLLPPSPLVRGCSLLSSTEADPQGIRHLTRKFLAPAKKECWLGRGAGRGEESSSPGMDIPAKEAAGERCPQGTLGEEPWCWGSSRRQLPWLWSPGMKSWAEITSQALP